MYVLLRNTCFQWFRQLPRCVTYMKSANVPVGCIIGRHWQRRSFYVRFLGTWLGPRYSSAVGIGLLDLPLPELLSLGLYMGFNSPSIGLPLLWLLPLRAQLLRLLACCIHFCSHSSWHCKSLHLDLSALLIRPLAMECSSHTVNYVGGSGCTVCLHTRISLKHSSARVGHCLLIVPSSMLNTSRSDRTYGN